MKADVTLAQAQADLARVAREIAAEQPRSNAGWGVRLVSFGDWLLGPTYRRTVWGLFGAVGCLVLLTCANVANLLVAQGVAREGEMGVRTAPGASRGRVVRQLFTESLVLALLGVAGGVDAGSGTEQVLTVPLQLPETSYGGDRQRAFVRDVVARAAALPGVRSAAVTVTNPFHQWGYANDVTPADRAATTPPTGLLIAGWRSVTPDFFRTLGAGTLLVVGTAVVATWLPSRCATRVDPVRAVKA